MIIRENYGEEHHEYSKTPDTGVTEPGILTRKKACSL